MFDIIASSIDVFTCLLCMFFPFSDSLVTPKNYFHMLSEGPIETLGRLMFSLKIFPEKYDILFC